MKYLFSILCLIIVMSCNNSATKNQRILTASSGKINNVSIVIDNDLWQGSVGETIRETLASAIVALPQDEPLFSLHQIPPQVFSGFVTKNRTIVMVQKQDGKPSIDIKRNMYAKPQTVIKISAEDIAQISNLIQTNSDTIITTLKAEEIKEKQRRISLSLHRDDSIQKHLGISIKFPSAYRIAKSEDDFFWIRKDITTGTTNIMLYELPYSAITDNDSLVEQLIRVRDSVGKVHIPGPTEGSYMITEKALSPFMTKTTLTNKPTVEVKGMWEVKHAFMAGPFLNYIIDDKANNRLIVAEGFTFAPSVSKRDYMFELEAIIKSIKFL